MTRILAGLIAAITLCATSPAQYVTLSGSLQASNGMPASNYILSFTPSQMGYISGTGIMVNSTTYCATSLDGTVVALPNPLQATTVTPGFTGTLPPANYYVKIGFYDASGNLTLVSPETVIQLNSTGQLIVASPSSGMPAGAVGMKVYISASTNAETLQGQTTGSAAFIQSIPLTSGAAVPSSNTTVCKQVANDAIWPSGTGYTVALTDPSGNTLPGYPMMWQLMGPNTTINLSNGLPYYHGTVYFPTPILASPLNHAGQSIAGPLNLSGYNLTGVGAIGVGTTLPAWPIDVENGFINSNLGYLANGNAGTSGQCLASGGASGPDSWINCLTSVTSYYQHIEGDSGSSRPQRPALLFWSPLTATDNPSNGSTDISLAPSGVTAGSYTSANITVDALGRILAAASGTGGSGTGSLAANGYWKFPGGLIVEWMTSATDFPSNARITATETWPTPFPNGCFVVQATPKFDSTVTTDFQGVSVYVNPGNCQTSVNLYGEVRNDGNADSTYHALLIAIGY